MSDELVKTNDPNYMKNPENGSLVSTDVRAFKKFKLQQEHQEKLKIKENDLNNIKSEVSSLKDELGEIKDILKQLLNK
jgi:hypothetical protein